MTDQLDWDVEGILGGHVQAVLACSDPLERAHFWRRLAEYAEGHAVRACVEAKATGSTWQEIADITGISRQAAAEHYRPLLDHAKL